MKAELRYCTTTGESGIAEIDIPFDLDFNHMCTFSRIKTPFERFCEKIDYPTEFVKGTLDFIYYANKPLHGNKIQCIKLIKMLDRTTGLREAKELIESIYEGG